MPILINFAVQDNDRLTSDYQDFTRQKCQKNNNLRNNVKTFNKNNSL